MATTPCVNCGEPLAEGTRFCSNCGTRQPDPPAQPAQDAPTAMIPSVPPPPPAGSQGAGGVAPTILASPPPQTPPGGYSTPPQTPPGGYGASQTPAGGYGAPPPTKKSRMPLILGILGALALCLIVGVVAVIGSLTLLGRQVSGVFTTIEAGLPTIEATSGSSAGADPTRRPTRARATPTAEAESTPEAEATPTEDVAATEAALLGEQATAEAGLALEATAAIATAQAEQAAAGQAQQATAQALVQGAQVVFRDEFVDNRNAWFIGRFEDKETNAIEGGVFRVIRDAKGRSFELYQVRALTNVVSEVDCKVLAGNDGGCGIVYGENENQGHWEWEVFNDYWRLSIIEGDNNTLILEGDPTGIIRPNDFNKLRVIRRDGIAYLYLNDVLINTSDDNRFAKGRVGVLTSSYQDSGQVEIQFDNFIVSEIR